MHLAKELIDFNLIKREFCSPGYCKTYGIHYGIKLVEWNFTGFLFNLFEMPYGLCQTTVLLRWESSQNRMYMYIHNWPIQPFSQYYGLTSHITHVVCFIFIHHLQYNVNSERHIFEKLFMAILFTLRIFAR